LLNNATTLSGSAYNVITVPTVPNAVSCNVYRIFVSNGVTGNSATIGLIGNVSSPGTLSDIGQVATGGGYGSWPSALNTPAQNNTTGMQVNQIYPTVPAQIINEVTDPNSLTTNGGQIVWGIANPNNNNKLELSLNEEGLVYMGEYVTVTSCPAGVSSNLCVGSDLGNSPISYTEVIGGIGTNPSLGVFDTSAQNTYQNPPRRMVLTQPGQMILTGPPQGANLAASNSSCAGWTLTTGWACASGIITHTSGNAGTATFTPTAAIVPGNTYNLAFTFTRVGGSGVTASVGGGSNSLAINSNGSVVLDLLAASSAGLVFTPASNATLTINVSTLTLAQDVGGSVSVSYVRHRPVFYVDLAVLASTAQNGDTVFCGDCQNFLDDSLVVGSAAAAGGHGASLVWVNGTSWRTMN